MSVWNGQYFLQNPAASVRLPLVEDALCAVEYGRIVQCDDAAVGPRFKVYTHGIAALEMASAEVIPHYLYIHSQFIRNTLGAAARKLVLDTAQLIKGYCDSYMVLCEIYIQRFKDNKKFRTKKMKRIFFVIHN